MGIKDDDDSQLIPRNADELIFICSFNDGTKGPADHAGENKILPDIYKLIVKSSEKKTNKDGNNVEVDKYEVVPLPQHRHAENDFDYHD